MIIVERGAYPQEGIGKPDYTREISLGRERPGITLKHNQSLKIFGAVFSSVNTGTHTAAPHLTIMTDAAAHFTVNALVLLTIINVTDGSSGVIIANTETTVTVALAGGITNQWNTGDAYTILSPFATVKLPLAAGVMAHIVDYETGLDMPYTVPQGYTMTSLSGTYSFTQDAILRVFYETFMVSSLGAPAGGGVLYVAEILGWGTYLLDPTGASSHVYDIQITNQGGDNLEGAGSVLAILEAVGTEPLPTTKTVKCKFCSHEETVPRETTKWICPNCNQLNIYFDLSKFRGTP